MTHHLNRVFRAARIPLLIGIVVIFILTSALYSFSKQNAAKENGLGIMLIDITPGLMGVPAYEEQVRKTLNCPNVVAYTLESSAASDYAATIENYDLYKYIAGLAESENYELLFLTKDMLPKLVPLQCLMPLPEALSSRISTKDLADCSVDDIVYGFPLLNAPATAYGAVLSDAALRPVYAVICKNGDTINTAIQYLQWIADQQGGA